MNDALKVLLNYTDPDGDYTPATTPADAIAADYIQDDGCWQTHTGTHYPSLASVPWQAQGSAVLVACDGTGPAHD